jgi:hypothetical protein
MSFRFEYDASNKILLGRFEGELNQESAAAFYAAIRKYGIATDARAGIWDFSSATENVASESIRRVARQEAAMPDPTNRPCFIVAPNTHLFGLSRMFQIAGEHKRPLLQVVRNLDEALGALGVKSAHFEPLD